MILNSQMLTDIESANRMTLPEKLKEYLLEHYGKEQCPYEYSDQDLHEQIRKDIRAYAGGKLNITC